MKKNIQHPKPDDLKAAYEAADDSGKTILETLYGKETFEKDLTDRIKTFDDVISISGANAKDYDFTPTNNQDVDSGNNMAMWLLIVFCLNGNKHADWGNPKQEKFLPYNEFSPGSGWSYYVYVDWYTFAIAGARQAFLDRESLKFARTQFPEIYRKAYQLI